MKFVRITHPEVEGVGVVSDLALDHYRSLGWELADEQPLVDVGAVPDDEPKRPQKNDSTEAWRAYAKERGMAPDEADRKGRDELVAHYDTQES